AVGAALAMQAMPNVFIGAEARTLRHYEGLGLNSFAGQAFYIGPTFYATFGRGYFLSAAWNVQVWGAVAGSLGALDLVNFERHQGKVGVGVVFGTGGVIRGQLDSSQIKADRDGEIDARARQFRRRRRERFRAAQERQRLVVERARA